MVRSYPLSGHASYSRFSGGKRMRAHSGDSSSPCCKRLTISVRCSSVINLPPRFCACLETNLLLSTGICSASHTLVQARVAELARRELEELLSIRATGLDAKLR